MRSVFANRPLIGALAIVLAVVVAAAAAFSLQRVEGRIVMATGNPQFVFHKFVRGDPLDGSQGASTPVL